MINVWDYLKEYEVERDEILGAIQEVLESGHLILGEKVSSFEEAFTAYCGSKFGIGVNSGTDAIFLGLKALNVGAGDEVITVANTAVPTVSAIEATGARARFVDIDPDTYLMDVSKLEAEIGEAAKCILPVHLFGNCVDMDSVGAVAARHSIKVMEDCAQAHGARQGSRLAGSMSDISAFSFYPTKILGAYGDGGMIVTADEGLYHRCKRLRFYGMENQYYALEHGYNSRLDELQAAILLSKFRHLDTYVTRRRQIAEIYLSELRETDLVLPVEHGENDHSFYLFVCRHPERDKLIELMAEQNVRLNVSYRWPIHTMPAYQHLGYKEGDLPETESAAREIFSLPMYPSLTDDQAFQVCHALKTTLSSLHS